MMHGKLRAGSIKSLDLLDFRHGVISLQDRGMIVRKKRKPRRVRRRGSPWVGPPHRAANQLEEASCDAGNGRFGLALRSRPLLLSSSLAKSFLRFSRPPC